MKIELLSIGSTTDSYLKEGIQLYEDRLKHYLNFKNQQLPYLKTKGKISKEIQKKKEGELLLHHIKSSDYTILLDERGKSYSSIEFSHFLQKRFNEGHQKINFIIGGPFGFSEEIYQTANFKLALSPMTFSHQMVRLFFIEQLYRAMTILKGEKYHH